MQGWDRQPWQLSVIRICLGGQALQAKEMILTKGSSKYLSSAAAASWIPALTGVCSPSGLQAHAKGQPHPLLDNGPLQKHVVAVAGHLSGNDGVGIMSTRFKSPPS